LGLIWSDDMEIGRMIITRKLQALSVLFLLFIMLPAGCDGKKERTLGTGTAPTKGQISKEELRRQLNDFSDYFKTTINTTAEEIDQKTTSKKNLMISLQNRSKALQSFYTVSQQDDVVVSFIDTWALCMRLRIYYEEGEGAKIYGENQPIAIDAAKRIESRVMDIGKLFLSDNAFNTTQRNISEFARANPIKANFSNLVVFATEVKKGEKNQFEKIINVPMAPFRGMEGVEHTALAIGRFSDTADHFSDVVADLPESSRWQLLLFLYELEETDMAKSFVSSTAKLSDSSVRLADSSEKLPELIREQLSILLDEIDKKQTNLQTTLAQADKTSASVQMAIEKVKEGANSVDAAANSVKETAEAWQGAAVATGDAVKEIIKLIPSQGATPSFNIKDIQEIAENVTQTAVEVRATAADLRQLSGVLTWRIIEIIAAILAATLIYRMLVIRIDRTRGEKKRDS
jgi:hypothetical protein